MAPNPYLSGHAFSRPAGWQNKETCEALMEKLDEKCEELGALLTEIRLAGSHDRGEGQPVSFQVWVPQKRGVSTTLTAAKPGSTVEMYIDNVGVQKSTAIAPVYITSENRADGVANEKRITGRLRPTYNPKSDIYMTRALNMVALLLQPDELAALKVPQGLLKKLQHPTGTRYGFEEREKPDLTRLDEGESWTKNRRRAIALSGISEILPAVHRIIDPCADETFAHDPLPQFGLGFDMHRLAHDQYQKKAEAREQAEQGPRRSSRGFTGGGVLTAEEIFPGWVSRKIYEGLCCCCRVGAGRAQA